MTDVPSPSGEAGTVEAGPTPAEQSFECMYTDDCNTGSQPRKAISHIFGRNKSCTRGIPHHVWVYYCRKHYQRSRYRNAHEYAKLQCKLVQQQIQRIQAWSDENQQNERPGVVNDWSLAIRKREKDRLDKQKKYGKKRAHDDDEDVVDEEHDKAILNGTAVPEWLLEQCGVGFSSTQLLEIFARIEDEIEHKQSKQIPDIEILPNIDLQDPEDGDGINNKTNTTSSRPRATANHRRTRSQPAERTQTQQGTIGNRHVRCSTAAAEQPAVDELSTGPPSKFRRVDDSSERFITIPDVLQHPRRGPALGRIPETHFEESDVRNGKTHGLQFRRNILPDAAPLLEGSWQTPHALEAESAWFDNDDHDRHMQRAHRPEPSTWQYNRVRMLPPSSSFDFRVPAHIISPESTEGEGYKAGGQMDSYSAFTPLQHPDDISQHSHDQTPVAGPSHVLAHRARTASNSSSGQSQGQTLPRISPAEHSAHTSPSPFYLPVPINGRRQTSRARETRCSVTYTGRARALFSERR